VERGTMIGTFIAEWIAGTVVYLILAGKFAADEAVAAGLTGLCTALVLHGLRAEVRSRYEFRPSWIWLLMKRIPLRALMDSVTVLKLAFFSLFSRSPIEGELIPVPFDAGGDDGESRARRALVAIGVTFPPNTLAVVIDRENGTLLIHRLQESGAIPDDKKWPI
jgi:multisubunit Na+/H+ antiporter MnhE subunit